MNFLPHEQRVIDEKIALDNRIQLLHACIIGPLFKQVDPAEQTRMLRQQDIMDEFSDILAERISAFVPQAEPADTSGMIPVHVNAIPDPADDPDAGIKSLDEFAMLVDQWHSAMMELGNRVIELGAEGVVITLEDDTKPGEAIQMTLDAITAKVFRVGAMAALNVFKDLPFAASIEEDTPPDAAG